MLHIKHNIPAFTTLRNVATIWPEEIWRFLDRVLFFILGCFCFCTEESESLSLSRSLSLLSPAENSFENIIILRYKCQNCLCFCEDLQSYFQHTFFCQSMLYHHNSLSRFVSKCLNFQKNFFHNLWRKFSSI